MGGGQQDTHRQTNEHKPRHKLAKRPVEWKLGVWITLLVEHKHCHWRTSLIFFSEPKPEQSAWKYYIRAWAQALGLKQTNCKSEHKLYKILEPHFSLISLGVFKIFKVISNIYGFLCFYVLPFCYNIWQLKCFK